MLTERKTRLETTITALRKERADLTTQLETVTLNDDQIVTIEEFAKKVVKGLDKAEGDFKTRRQIIDLLDVRATLAIEDGQKVAYVRCLVDKSPLSIESTSSCAILPQIAGQEQMGCRPILSEGASPVKPEAKRRSELW